MTKTAVTVFLLFGLSVGAMAQQLKVQSIFIHSFTRYVQWPDAYNQGDFEIVVLGDSPIIDELNLMAQSKKVGERNIKVTKINSADDIKKCNILVVPSGKAGTLASIIGKINNQSILVITDDPGMGAKGSDINFVVRDGKQAFELNQSAMNKKNLKASNELSRLAILI